MCICVCVCVCTCVSVCSLSMSDTVQGPDDKDRNLSRFVKKHTVQQVRGFRVERWQARHALRRYGSTGDWERGEVMEGSGRSSSRATSSRMERGHRELGVGDVRWEEELVQVRGPKR